MMWLHIFLMQAFSVSMANSYPPITDIQCEARLVHEDSVVPLFHLPVPVSLGPMLSHLAMYPGKCKFPRKSARSRRCQQRPTRNGMDATASPDGANSERMKHCGGQEAINSESICGTTAHLRYLVNHCVISAGKNQSPHGLCILLMVPSCCDRKPTSPARLRMTRGRQRSSNGQQGGIT